MMTDVLMTIIVVMVFAIIIAALRRSYPRELRVWPVIAFVVYLLSATAELLMTRVITDGGDTQVYGATGAELAKVLDRNFSWGASELLALFFQQPSAFDSVVYGGGGGNTGSMHAMAGFVVFALQGSEIAAHVFVAMLSMCGALGLYSAFRDSDPAIPQHRLFAASVLIPSVTYWTSALHKEALCLSGMGLLFVGWRAMYKGGWVRAILCVPVGLVLIYLFRAPAILPVSLGLAVFFVVDRVRKLGGPQATAVLTPIYFAVSLIAFTLAMVVLTRLTPSLGLDQVNETMMARQEAWKPTAGMARSTYGVDEDTPTTLGGQVLRLPLALLNALFRPQLFDVHNFTALLSALEMTLVSVLVIRAIWRQGVGGIITRIQRSPFLAMCLVVTFVGCALVGIVTRNFGSLVRYRAPFLPFYGALLLALNHAPERLKELATGAATNKQPRGGALGKPAGLLARARVRRASREERQGRHQA